MDISKVAITRPVLNEDVPFIFNSWLKSFRSSFFAKAVPNVMYYTNHHKIIEHLLKTCETLVACNPEDTTQIYGYICYMPGTPNIVHYTYVKEHFRRLGIAKHLFEKAGIDLSLATLYSHHTSVSSAIAEKKNMFHCPYLMLSKVIEFDTKETNEQSKR